MSALERARERLAQMNATPIAEAADGELVKIVGEVVALEETLVGPFDQVECVAYRLRKESANHVVDFVEAVEFGVRDESGVANVSVDDARGILDLDEYEGVPGGHERCWQATLASGDEVAILGVARWHTSGGGYRDVRRARLVDPANDDLYFSNEREALHEVETDEDDAT